MESHITKNVCPSLIQLVLLFVLKLRFLETFFCNFHSEIRNKWLFVRIHSDPMNNLAVTIYQNYSIIQCQPSFKSTKLILTQKLINYIDSFIFKFYLFVPGHLFGNKLILLTEITDCQLMSNLPSVNQIDSFYQPDI